MKAFVYSTAVTIALLAGAFGKVGFGGGGFGGGWQ
jgi:hypothetical protein